VKFFALILANFTAFSLLSFKCFVLLDGILSEKHYGRFFGLIIAMLNSALGIALALSLPLSLNYAILTAAIFLELGILFRRTAAELLSVTAAVVMNIMCFREIVISALALAVNKTILGVMSDRDLYLTVLTISGLTAFFILEIFLHFYNIEDMRRALNNRAQARYILIWSSLCVVFVFLCAGYLSMNGSSQDIVFFHLTFCFLLLLSFFYLLNYSFVLARTCEKHKNLSKELVNQIELQSAITRDAVYVAHANLTQDKIIKGLEVYGEKLDYLHNSYDAWFKFAGGKIYEQDYVSCFKAVERQALLRSFELGIEPAPFEYRRREKEGSFRWVRSMVRMFKDAESGDVHVFGYAFDIQNEVLERQNLKRSAQIDLFTGLYNKLTTETIISAKIGKESGTVLLLDIDDFKEINDRYGHEAGDHVLKLIAELLRDTFRKCDVIGRIGGDEFMLYIKDAADPAPAMERASEINRRLLSTAVEYIGRRFFVSVSIGITVTDKNTGSFSEAYKQVDSALYQAKKRGKGTFVVYDVTLESSAV